MATPPVTSPADQLPSLAEATGSARSSFWYPLFEHMSREHGLTLLESELSEIVGVVADIIRPQMTEDYIAALKTALEWCERDLAGTPDSGYAERVKFLRRALLNVAISQPDAKTTNT